MLAIFAETSGGGLAAGDVDGGLRRLGSTPRVTLELAGCLDTSSDAGGRECSFWVHRGSPEVGEEVCCSSGQMEGAGGLLEVG